MFWAVSSELFYRHNKTPMRWKKLTNYMTRLWPWRVCVCARVWCVCVFSRFAAATDAKLLQSCPTLCDPVDGSPPGYPVPGILQARTLEWVAISFSNAWKWKVKVKLPSCVQLSATPWTAVYQAPPSMEFSRQEYWIGLSLPSLKYGSNSSQLKTRWTHSSQFIFPCEQEAFNNKFFQTFKKGKIAKKMLILQCNTKRRNISQMLKKSITTFIKELGLK